MAELYVCSPHHYPPKINLSLRGTNAAALWALRYQIAMGNPQTDKDLEDPENRAKFLKFMYRGVNDTRAVGNFQVTENLLAGIGENQLSSLFTEKVRRLNAFRVIFCLYCDINAREPGIRSILGCFFERLPWSM